MFIFFLGLFLSMNTSLRINEGSEPILKNQGLLENEYIDPKGFFKIRPPSGWQIREYIDDPRGKVDFESSLNIPKAQLKIGGMANPFPDYEKFIHDLEMQAERIKFQYKQYNASITTEKTTFANMPALKIYFNIPDKLKQVHIHFIKGDNYYTLLFGAPPDLYEKFFSVAIMSFESFEPVSKNVTKDEVVKHNVQSKLRAAMLAIQMGQKEYALTIINEGLQIDPNNSDLLELKKQITNK